HSYDCLNYTFELIMAQVRRGGPDECVARKGRPRFAPQASGVASCTPSARCRMAAACPSWLLPPFGRRPAGKRNPPSRLKSPARIDCPTIVDSHVGGLGLGTSA